MTAKTERRTPQGAASRRRILDAAVELLSELGIARTSVNAICSRAGVAKTALYWHFGSKQGLLQVAMEEVASQWVTKIEEQVASVGTPGERLDRLVDGLRVIIEEEAHLLQLIEAVRGEHATVGDELKRVVADIDQRSVDAMVRGFETAMGWPVPDMDLLARHIIWALLGIMRDVQIAPGRLDLDRVFKDLKQTISVLVTDRLRRQAKKK